MSKKRIALLMAVVMVLGVAVGSTMAWLTSGTDPVVNTFTVGDINIDLKEHEYISETDVATDPALAQQVGTLGAKEVTSNDDYLFVPGDTLPKDPFVKVKKGSEDSYVFIKVQALNNSLTVGEETADPILSWHVLDQGTHTNPAGTPNTNPANGWVSLGDGVYYRTVTKEELATVNGEYKNFPIFVEDEVQVSTDVTKAMVDTINGTGGVVAKKPTIKIYAYAHQIDNVEFDTVKTSALGYFTEAANN